MCRRVYTTNIMERLMREVKRRTDFVGIFPSGSFCDRFVGAQLLERHESWQCETIRCLVMDHIAQTPPKQPGPHDAENH